MSTLATQIRDAACARILAVMTDFKSDRKVPFPTIQPDQVPALGVFLLSEQANADGDANVGPPRYVVDATISIAVVDLASKPEVLDGSVDARVDLIQNTLLSDGTFIDLRDTATGLPIIESIPQLRRSFRFPKEGEAYYCEVTLSLTFRFREFFEPVAPNLLKEIAVQTTTQFSVNQQPIVADLKVGS